MNYYGYELIRESDLTHHGIKGQKWGQRRFQNEDGTWTAAGKERYGDDGGGQSRSFRGNVNRALAKVYGVNEKYYSKHGNKVMANANKSAKEAQLKKAEEADKAKNTPEAKARAEKLKKAAKIGAAVAGTALVAYGAYKLNKVLNDNTSMHYREMSQYYFEKYGKHSIAAEGYAMGGFHGPNKGITNTNASFERSMAKDYLSKSRDYRSLARQGKYSLREKAETAKRMIRR